MAIVLFILGLGMVSIGAADTEARSKAMAWEVYEECIRESQPIKSIDDFIGCRNLAIAYMEGVAE